MQYCAGTCIVLAFHTAQQMPHAVRAMWNPDHTSHWRRLRRAPAGSVESLHSSLRALAMKTRNLRSATGHQCPSHSFAPHRDVVLSRGSAQCAAHKGPLATPLMTAGAPSSAAVPRTTTPIPRALCDSQLVCKCTSQLILHTCMQNGARNYTHRILARRKSCDAAEPARRALAAGTSRASMFTANGN